jgi:hydroxymethylglutaryl-CoA lyase
MVRKMAEKLKILETFRDAIQGLEAVIPADQKVKIIRSLYKAGFDFLDIGSFVSPRLIPQFRDMERVLDMVGEPPSQTRTFVLAGNLEGAKRACSFRTVDVVGFPFSTSETFLKKNINANFKRSWSRLEQIREECDRSGKTLMVYLAMAFGNPYGDPVSEEICLEWSEKLHTLGINNIHLSDIIGTSTPEQISQYYRSLSAALPGVEFGIHLHISKADWYDKIHAAFSNGCRVFDGVISGLGGCPMTGYEMLENLPTANLLEFADRNMVATQIDREEFAQARIQSLETLSGFLEK